MQESDLLTQKKPRNYYFHLERGLYNEHFYTDLLPYDKAKKQAERHATRNRLTINQEKSFTVNKRLDEPYWDRRNLG